MADKKKSEEQTSETLTPDPSVLTAQVTHVAPSGRGEADALGSGEIPQEVPSPPAPLPQGERGEGEALIPDPAVLEEPHPQPLSTLERGEGDTDGDVVEDVAARDIRTDPFLVLVVRPSGATGFRLGTMAPRDVVSVSGDLTEDAGGLIAWFANLPGEVRFRDGARVVVRYNESDELVAEVL